MSFDSWDSSGRSSGYQSSARKDGDTEYLRLSQLVKANVFDVDKKASNLEKLVSYLGTQRDVPEMRNRITALQEQTRNTIRETSMAIKQLGRLDGGSGNEGRKRELQAERLGQSFGAVLKKWQGVTKDLVAKEKETVAKQQAQQRARVDSFRYADDERDDQRLLDERNREQEQMDQQIEFNAALIEEREEGIREIEASMVEVNQVFRDLSTLVHDQGDMLDSIEGNMASTYSSVDQGVQQLTKASHYQKKARNKLMCIFVIVAIVAAIIVIVLVTQLKKPK